MPSVVVLCNHLQESKPLILENAISDFIKFYRENFTSSMTIKLHLLENHVVPFIKKWRFGLGLYGEQGAESIHPEFNSLKATYAPVKPATKRLKVMLEQHLMKVSPISKTFLPTIKRRKISAGE